MTWSSAGSGSVTSVSVSVPSFLSVSGSPVTSSGTIAVSLSGTALPIANGGTGSTTATGSGSVVLANSSTLITPVLGAATGTSLSVSGQITSTVSTGTAPLVISSTTNVANLNASTLSGATFASPGSIGSSTPGSGAFTSISASSGLTVTSGSSSLQGMSATSGSFTGAVNLNSNKITSLATPTASSDAATKGYVDALTQGLSTKNSVVAATTIAGTLSSSFANGSVIDSITLVTGNRILIKDQASAIENGIYIVASSGSPTRAVDFNTASSAAGSYVFTERGTANIGAGFVCISVPGSDLVGTDNITFTQFSGAGQVIAGTGLSKSANTLSVNTAQTQITSVGMLSALTVSGQITSTASTGTAPFVIASTTNVPNLNASSLSGATFASPGAIGGTTPGSAAFTTISASSQITSTISTGTAPLVITSTTNVPNLNASTLSGATFASPGPIGSTSASSGAFSSLGASSGLTVSSGNLTVSSGTGSFQGTTASTSSTTGIILTGGGISSSNTTDATSASSGGGATLAGGLAAAKKIISGSSITGTQLATGANFSPTGSLHLRAASSTTSCNVIIEAGTASDGTNAGLSTINFNGYISSGEQRINTGKNRWRMLIDQRSTADNFNFDTYDGTTVNNILRMDTAQVITAFCTTASTSSTVGAVLLSGGISSSNTTDATSASSGGGATLAGGLAAAKKIISGSSITGTQLATGSNFSPTGSLHLRNASSTTANNVIIEAGSFSNGGTVGWSAINFNGYVDAGGDQRIDTGKNRWRIIVNQNSASDVMYIDTYNGSTATTPVSIATSGDITLSGKLYMNGITAAAVPSVRATGLFTNPGGTLTTLQSYNCSISKGGTGTYNISFTTNLPTANYVVTLGSQLNAANNDLIMYQSLATTGFQIVHFVGGSTADFSSYASFTVHL